MRSLTYTFMTSVCLLSLHAMTHDAYAKTEPSNSKWSGKIEVAVSTDRNAGAAPGGLRGGSSSRGGKSGADDNEDEDDSEVFDDDDMTGDDLLDDLDLEDPEFEDELDDLEDEADGVIGNEDFDGDGVADGEQNGEGVFDENGNEVADADGDGIFDEPAVDAGGDPVIDPQADPIVDAGVVNPVAVDPVIDAGADPAADPAPFRKVSAAKKAALVKSPPKGKRGDRLTFRAGVANSYTFDKSVAWKTGANLTSSNQRENNKKDGRIFALSSGPEFKSFGGDLTWGPSIVYAHVTKDDKHIVDVYAASFGAKYKINKKLGVKSKYTYSASNFDIAKADTSYGQKIGVALAAKPFAKTTSELGWSFNTVDVSPAEKERDAQQISLKLQQDFPYEIYLAGVTNYKWTDYHVAKRREPLRSDSDLTAGVSLGKEIWKDINMELQYDHRTFNTNIKGKDTSNDRFALVTGWKF